MNRLGLIPTVLLAGCASVPPQELAWQTVHAMDALQTVQIARSEGNCKREESHDTRFLIGESPSTGDALLWGIGTALGHLGVSMWLSDHAPRWAYVVWQSVTITSSGYYVVKNFDNDISITDSDCR